MGLGCIKNLPLPHFGAYYYDALAISTRIPIGRRILLRACKVVRYTFPSPLASKTPTEPEPHFPLNPTPLRMRATSARRHHL